MPLRRSLRKDSFALQAKDDQDRLSYMGQSFVSFHELFKPKMDLSEKCFRYVWGDSWDANLKKLLKEAGLSVETANILLPRVLRILGEEDIIKTQIKAVAPVNSEGIAQPIANAIFEWMEYEHSINDVFSNILTYALIGDIGGYGEWVWDRSNNIMGEPVFRGVNAFQCYRDPNKSFLNQRKWDFVGKSFWATPEAMVRDFPDKEEQIYKTLNPLDHESAMADIGSYEWAALDGGYVDNRDLFTQHNAGKGRLYRILEQQERVYEPGFVAVNPVNGKTIKVFKEDEIRRIKFNFPEIVAERTLVERIYTHTSIGDYVHLQSKPNDVQNGWFSLLGMGGYEFAEKNFSLVSQGLDLQESYNKTKSTIMHIMNTMASSGWMYEKGSLSEEAKLHLEKNGSKAGFQLEYENGALSKPEQLRPPSPPSAHWISAESHENDLSKVFSIGPDQLGRQEFSNEAAALNEQKVQNSMVTLNPLFRNFKRYKKIVGQYGWDLCKQKMHGTRILDYIDHNRQAQRVILNQVINGQTLNSVSGDFQFMIVNAPDTETQRRLKFAEMRDAAAMIPGEFIPMELIVQNLEYIDPEDKKMWVEYIRSLRGPSVDERSQLLSQLEFAAPDEEAELQQLLQGGAS